jgi:hypothetical protein
MKVKDIRNLFSHYPSETGKLKHPSMKMDDIEHLALLSRPGPDERESPRLPQQSQWVDYEQLCCTKCGKRQSEPIKRTRLSWKRSGFLVALVVSLLLMGIGTGNIVLTYFKPLSQSEFDWIQYLFSGISLVCAIVLLCNTNTPDRVSITI